MIVDLKGRFTMTVPEAGRLLGLGRDAAYDAADRGEIESITIGRRKVVPTHALLRRLGLPDELIAQIIGVTGLDDAEYDADADDGLHLADPASTGKAS